MDKRRSGGLSCSETVDATKGQRGQGTSPNALRRAQRADQATDCLVDELRASVASAAARATAMLSRTAVMYLMSSWGTAGVGGPDGAKGGGGGGRGPKPAATRKTLAVMTSLSPS